MSQYHLRYLYEGAIGKKQCRCNAINCQFISYASHVIAICDARKSTIVLATIKREETLWALMWGNNHVYPNSSRHQILFFIQE